MAVKECYDNEEPQQSPWVQTPLRESYALSEAAGWYGHTSSSPIICPTPHDIPYHPLERKGNSKSQKQNLPQAGESPTLWIVQVEVSICRLQTLPNTSANTWTEVLATTFSAVSRNSHKARALTSSHPAAAMPDLPLFTRLALSTCLAPLSYQPPQHH